MALRLMQIFIPGDADKDINDLLGGNQPLAGWRDHAYETHIVLHLLVSAEETEPWTK